MVMTFYCIGNPITHDHIFHYYEFIWWFIETEPVLINCDILILFILENPKKA